MTVLISATLYPAVRAAIDTSLDSNSLPDSIISLQIYHERAESIVLDVDPDAATRTGAEKTHIENATVFMIASLLAPAVPQITAERVGEISVNRKVDWNKRAEELRQLANEELAAVLEAADDTPYMPTMFKVATGNRGR